MKKIFYAALLLPALGLAQTTTQNFVKTTTYKKPTLDGLTINTASVPGYPAGSITDDDKVVNITYVDGLGRPVEQIGVRQSGSGKNIVTPIIYDQLGRQPMDYLPYPSQNTALDFVDPDSAITAAASYYAAQFGLEGDSPYSEKQFEASPLNRVLKQAAPGGAWKMSEGHTVKMEYQVNGLNEVKKFLATAAAPATGNDYYEISILQDGCYAPGELYKTITYDENSAAVPTEIDGSTVEFKDKEGHVVLKRTYEGGAPLDTYYLYDQFGNLTYVIPPMAADPIGTPDQLEKFCYQYKYDVRNRLVEKKLPGRQWEFIVYDKLDRVVATGPAFSPFANAVAPDNIGWLVTKYDAFNRPVYSGWLQSAAVTSAGRISLQADRNNATAISEAKLNSSTSNIDSKTIYYSNSVVPTSFKILSVSYYDNYTFPQPVMPFPATVEAQAVATQARGLKTGGWNRVSIDPGTTMGNTDVIYYDTRWRQVGSYRKTYTSGFTSLSSLLDFEGKAQSTVTQHNRKSNTGTPVYIKERFVYTPQGRLLKHTHQIGTSGAEQLLALNTYDELGQLASKNVGGPAAGTALQKVDFSYNIRGWLKTINSLDSFVETGAAPDLFAFKISYQDVTESLSGKIRPLYNGNISETLWKTGSDQVTRRYGYTYDNLNRLREAVYQKPGITTVLPGSYDEYMSYDKNGNITHLDRYGFQDDNVVKVKIDNLDYSYSGNQLAKVQDQTNSTQGFKDDVSYPDPSDDYSYDANGNLTADANKGIVGITYNHLNLPAVIDFGAAGKIEYWYSADGVKEKKAVTVGTAPSLNTDYLDGFQYEKGVLQFFPTAEGYVKNTLIGTVNNFNYVFTYKDHLGNVRLSYAQDPASGGLKILQEDNYYPFGMKHSGYNNSPTYEFVKDGSGNNVILATGNLKNKYKYNGKEWQDELGLNFYDYGARNYDPAIGRWMNLDPLAEQNRRWSPYNYAVNNPIYFIDPDGMHQDKGPNPNDIKGIGTSQEDLSFLKGGNECFCGEEGGPGDPPKPGEGTKSGSWENEDEHGAPTGVPSPPEQLEEVTIIGKNWAERNLVVAGSINGSVGVQVGGDFGIGEASVGIITTDIGSLGFDFINGENTSAWGDGTRHNYAEGSLGIGRSFSAGAGIDYRYHSEDGLNCSQFCRSDRYVQVGLASRYNLIKEHPGLNAVPGVKGSTQESDCYCLDFQVGLKVIFGIDASIKIGIKK